MERKFIDDMGDLTIEQYRLMEQMMENDAAELKKIARAQFGIIGNVEQHEEDELFSLASFVLWDSVKRYNGTSAKFSTFLINNIKNKYKTYVRDSLRDKRCASEKEIEVVDGKKVEKRKRITNVSLNDENSDGVSMADKVADKSDLFEEIFGNEKSEKITAYLNNLSRKQRKILELTTVNELEPKEIMQELHMSSKEFNENMRVIRDYSNIRYLM